ncbi:hypothetical protein RhiirA5_433731 [Rhizophagus irregularis]|uniref:Uncharacterized protein n=1 Tax=Rhizophagus irregularis TaxID=588596 RepID=A0A2N0NRA0_9GLOM|nr:hypothetical protein RhiirA5_433731 [Rhizophagus irregularis]
MQTILKENGDILVHQHIAYERIPTQQIEEKKITKEDTGEFYIGDGRALEQSIGWGTGSEF